MMLVAGRGALIGLMLEGALLATLQAGAVGVEEADTAVVVFEDCQRAVPAGKVTLSF